jgi:hypothetical protein
MKKIIAFTALAGLLAAGCASQNSRGGSDDNQVNAKYGTGNGPGTMGTSTNNPARASIPDSTVNSNPNSSDSTLTPKSQNP